MKKIMTIYLLLAGTMLMAQPQPQNPYANVKAPEYMKQVESWESLLQKAQNENKLIFIDLYFTGCFPCAQMDRDVFPNEVVAQKLQSGFITVKSDVFKEIVGENIIKKYLVSGFPTFLILSKDGYLIDRFSGFKEPGLLVEKLEQAIAADKGKKYLKGFSTTLNGNYPQMYHDYYNREDRKRLNDTTVNEWIKENRSTNPEVAAILFLAINKPDAVLEQEFINNYPAFATLFGSELSANKASDIMNKYMKEQIKSANDEAFNNFIKKYEKSFTAGDYNIIKMMLANNYFNTIAKDTTGYLKYMAKNPVLYQNYYGAYYSNLMAKKQLTPERIELLAAWGLNAMNDNTAMDAMATVARLLKQANNTVACKEVVNKIIAKGKKYKIETAGYEKILEGI